MPSYSGNINATGTVTYTLLGAVYSVKITGTSTAVVSINEIAGTYNATVTTTLVAKFNLIQQGPTGGADSSFSSTSVDSETLSGNVNAVTGHLFNSSDGSASFTGSFNAARTLISGSTTFNIADFSGSVTAPVTLTRALLPVISFDSGSLSISEGAGTATYTLSRSFVPLGDTGSTVRVTSVNGWAVAGQDFGGAGAVDRIVTFGAGQTSATFTVPITNDNLVEFNENFQLVLSDATDATIGLGSAQTTIIDNDGTVKATKNGAVLTGQPGPNHFSGSPGQSTIVNYAASPAGVTVNLVTGDASGGDAGDDELDDISGIIGSPFPDFIWATDGNNYVDGAAGIDTLSYEHAGAGVTVNLGLKNPQTTGGSGIDTILNFERLIGSSHNDTLTGGKLAGFIDGGGGDDVIVGGKANDELHGGAGNDRLDGGKGNDQLFGEGDNDTLIMSGKDSQGDTFNGGSGHDKILVLGSASAIIGNFDSVVAEIEEWQGNNAGLTGSKLGDRIDFSNIDTISGLPFIDGGKGDDLIIGSDLADDLRGNAGNDKLAGLGGNDILTGGKGNDGFAIDTGFGRDVVTDFLPGLGIGDTIVFNQDTLDSYGMNLATFRANKVIVSAVDGDSDGMVDDTQFVLADSPSDMLVVLNLLPNRFVDDDFFALSFSSV